MAGLGLLLLCVTASTAAPGAGERDLHIYSSEKSFIVTILERDGKPYVNLAEVLQQLGSLSTNANEQRFKLRFNNTEAQFQNGQTAVKIGHNTIKLSDNFLFDGEQGLLPLRSLPELLPQFLQQKVDFHETSRRIFIGNSAIHLHAEIKKSPASALVFTFSVPVSPQVSVERGILRMTFLRDGVSMASQSWKFDDPLITEAAYEETNIGPEITVHGSEPLLATFGDGGKTIMISVAPKLVGATQPPAGALVTPQTETTASAAPANPTPATTPPATTEQSATANPPTPNTPHGRFLILLDAGHGGEERGAALTDKLAEKDVTLALARRLRSELQNRGISAYLLRESDVTLTLEQRAATANAAQAAIYIAIHAGTLGRGVSIYTAMLTPVSNTSSVGFLPWESAQAFYLRSSRLAASQITAAIGKGTPSLPVALVPAPVRPLNNIAGAALAVEVAPRNGDAESLNDPSYQQSIAVALASAIAAARPSLEQAP